MEFMDSETGEILSVSRSNNLECHSFDLETGELLEDIDAESNIEDLFENQQKLRCVTRKPKKFNVPKSLIQEPKCENNAKFDCYLSSQETFTLTSKKRVIDLKEASYYYYFLTNDKINDFDFSNF